MSVHCPPPPPPPPVRSPRATHVGPCALSGRGMSRSKPTARSSQESLVTLLGAHRVLFDDKKSLGDESDSVQDQVRAASTSGDVPVDSAEAADCAGGEKDPKEADTDEDHEAEMIRKKAGKVLCGCVTVNWIPGIMFASDLLICLASGMTIKCVLATSPMFPQL